MENVAAPNVHVGFIARFSCCFLHIAATTVGLFLLLPLLVSLKLDGRLLEVSWVGIFAPVWVHSVTSTCVVVMHIKAHHRGWIRALKQACVFIAEVTLCYRLSHNELPQSRDFIPIYMLVTLRLFTLRHTFAAIHQYRAHRDAHLLRLLAISTSVTMAMLLSSVLYSFRRDFFPTWPVWVLFVPSLAVLALLQTLILVAMRPTMTDVLVPQLWSYRGPVRRRALPHIQNLWSERAAMCFFFFCFYLLMTLCLIAFNVCAVLSSPHDPLLSVFPTPASMTWALFPLWLAVPMSCGFVVALYVLVRPDYPLAIEMLETHNEAPVHRGMTKEQLDARFPVQEYAAADALSQECAICLCDLEAGELIRMFDCKHVYHAECIDKWLESNSTCPLCKVDFLHEDDGGTLVEIGVDDGEDPVNEMSETEAMDAPLTQHAV